MRENESARGGEEMKAPFRLVALPVRGWGETAFLTVTSGCSMSPRAETWGLCVSIKGFGTQDQLPVWRYCQPAKAFMVPHGWNQRSEEALPNRHLGSACTWRVLWETSLSLWLMSSKLRHPWAELKCLPVRPVPVCMAYAVPRCISRTWKYWCF